MFSIDFFMGFHNLSTAFKVLIPLALLCLVIGLAFVPFHKNEKISKIIKVTLSSLGVFIYLFLLVIWALRFNHNYDSLSSAQIVTIAQVNLYTFIFLSLSIFTLISAFKKFAFVEKAITALLPLAFLIFLFKATQLDFIIRSAELTHSMNICAFLQVIILGLLCVCNFKTNQKQNFLQNFHYTVNIYLSIVSILLFVNTLMLSNLSGLRSCAFLSKIYEAIGITIKYPYSFAITTIFTIIFVFVVALILNLILKKLGKLEIRKQYHDFFEVNNFLCKSICPMFTYIAMSIIIFVAQATRNCNLAFAFIIPLCMAVLSIWFIIELEKITKNSTDEIFEENNAKQKKILTYALICNIILGVYLKSQFKKEREGIEYEKERQAKLFARQENNNAEKTTDTKQENK